MKERKIHYQTVKRMPTFCGKRPSTCETTAHAKDVTCGNCLRIIELDVKKLLRYN
jgi:hypothetical protein